MGSTSRKRFVNQAATKARFEAMAKHTRPHRQTFCRICGQTTTGQKYCPSCKVFITKKGHEHDKP